MELTQGTLVHAPTAWLGSFHSCPNRCFPKPKFQVWAWTSMSVGLPPTPSARLAAAGVRCRGKCKAPYYSAGHHTQTCVCHSLSAYYSLRGHEDLLAVWKELSVCAGVPVMILPSNLKLPRPVLTGDNWHSDIKWDWPTLRGVVIVGDKSALHPFVGKGNPHCGAHTSLGSSPLPQVVFATFCCSYLKSSSPLFESWHRV
eukprot:955008-Rhodomonas_salina.1